MEDEINKTQEPETYPTLHIAETAIHLGRVGLMEALRADPVDEALVVVLKEQVRSARQARTWLERQRRQEEYLSQYNQRGKFPWNSRWYF